MGSGIGHERTGSGCSAMDLFDRHRQRLAGAMEAIADRRSWSAFPGSARAHPDEAEARRQGLAAFERRLGGAVDLGPVGIGRLVTQTSECSPFTGESLSVQYRRIAPDVLVGLAAEAGAAWRQVPSRARVGICLEIVQRLYDRAFELQAAAQHTTGQSPGMAYTGSGTNALDRGIEAISQAYTVMERVPESATWERPFGTTVVRLDKRFTVAPRGVAIVVCCASFPAWNAYPALFASLATGNPVVMKPHPSSVLQMAIAVEIAQEVLLDCGLPRNVVTLAVDEPENMITMALVQDPRVGIVDYTGGPLFGSLLERTVRSAAVFTETAGTNAVVVHSARNLQGMTRVLAGGLSLFSAQMCTSPQNVFVPRSGFATADGWVDYQTFCDALAASLDAIASVPVRAASVLGAIQAQRTVEMQAEVEKAVSREGRIVAASGTYEHPDYPAARTRTPLVAEVGPDRHHLYGEERFGPVSFVIPVDSPDAGLAQSVADARRCGAIASYVYSEDEAFLARSEEAFAAAGASLSANLVGPMPMNFSAAYSDYHVTGLNPAGTATLTDEAFVSGRFRILQSRRQR